MSPSELWVSAWRRVRERFMPCETAAERLPDEAGIRRLGLQPLRGLALWWPIGFTSTVLAVSSLGSLHSAQGRVLLLFMLACAGLGFAWLARWVWAWPSSSRVFRSSLGGALGMVLVALIIKHGASAEEAEWLRLVFMGLGVTVMGGVSFVSIYRRHQILARQRELAERELALAAQAQLAQAQIQPHFLFNSLASLQHWVHQGDRRAAPLLDALTAYLRATLPLFNRRQLSLGEELEAVRQYLAVMQARLGARLQVEIEVPDELRSIQLPPALLLTLVENAIEHGVVPKLGIALLRIEARQAGAVLCLQVRDDGPGLPEQMPLVRAGRGVGLSNSRLRLTQTFGDEASLSLENSAETGGCVATLRLPIAMALPPALLA
ncbi:sensor histidine kinase [Roseateles sp.]|uniref:sensor histidine kinase n=1 Tax=Roseateles sp. TaxID=1971397 RepID=UPI003D1003F5